MNPWFTNDPNYEDPGIAHFIQVLDAQRRLENAYLLNFAGACALVSENQNKQTKQTESMNENNILDMDLATVETSRPLIIAGLYDLTIKDAVIEPSGKTPPIPLLKLTLTTTSSTQSDKGESVDPGLELYHNCSLQPSGKATVKMIAQNVASIVQAVGLTGVTLGTVADWHKQLCGRLVRCRVTIRAEQTRDGKTYGPRNEIQDFIKQ
jgi:hypothetical protein